MITDTRTDKSRVAIQTTHDVTIPYLETRQEKMSTGEKSDHIPPSYVDSAGHPFAPGPVTGYEGQQPAQYPAPTQVVYRPAPATAYPAPPAYPYPQQQQAASVVVVGGAPANQNVLVVRTVRANVQIPDVYPGLAFCQFVPGMLETFIRSATAVR